jgi:hypothetical protein
VVEVLENLQALLDDFVTLVALDMSDEADAAGVMLVLRVVQTLGGGNRVKRLLVVVHGDTVCEEAGQAVKPLFFAAVRFATATAPFSQQNCACRKASEIGIYATNQWNSK